MVGEHDVGGRAPARAEDAAPRMSRCAGEIEVAYAGDAVPGEFG
jgi:hypothetical protein